MIRLQLLLAVFVLCNIAGANESRVRKSETSVLLTRLIEAPDAYDGKVVLVSGFAFIEFENNNLCLLEKQGIPRNCIWINYFDGVTESDADFARYQKAKKKWSRFNRRHISLRGTFDASDTGHLGGSSGGIGHITEVSISKNHRK
ncbi:MAG: hypothetical protein ACREPB_05070 [Arenimonas sp.]